MEIRFSSNAYSSLVRVVNFIESKNTKGSGLRWASRFESFLLSSLIKPSEIKLCNNKTFRQLNLRCIYFNDWVVAFSCIENLVLIELILHKSRITD